MNKKIALINDKKIYYRSAIDMEMPIIAAFGDIAVRNVSENKNVDAVITGYFEKDADILKAREYIADIKLDSPNVLALVDPDFADDGIKYDGISDNHITNYKRLMEISDIIAPNFTEACMLADVSYDENRQKYCTIEYDGKDKDKTNEVSKKILESMFPLLEKLRFKKNQITIITGIELYNVILTVLDVYDGDHRNRQTTCNYAEKVEGRAGAGEIFDAMYFETSTNGLSLVDALSVSTSFINNSLRYSRDKKYDKNDGIVYEPILIDNVITIRNKVIENKNNSSGRPVGDKEEK